MFNLHGGTKLRRKTKTDNVELKVSERACIVKQVTI